MAKENIVKFFEAAVSDQGLAEQISGLAAENGCAFSAQELLEIGEQRPLSDEEVDDAAGGNILIDLLWRGLHGMNC